MDVCGEFHAPTAFPWRKEPPCTHRRGGCLGPRPGLDTDSVDEERNPEFGGCILVPSKYVRYISKNQSTYLLTPWHYSSRRTLAASHILCQVSWQQIFRGWGRQPHAQPPTCRTRVSLLVWQLHLNLSDMGGPTSSYSAVGTALEFIVAHKTPHPATKCFRQGWDTIEGENKSTHPSL
jgi:hypothetical protein